MRSSVGGTALHNAAGNGHVSVCRVLLDSEEFPEAEAVADWGGTALHAAAWRGHAAACEALLAAGRFRAAGVRGTGGFYAGCTARDLAVDFGHQAVLAALDAAPEALPPLAQPADAGAGAGLTAEAAGAAGPATGEAAGSGPPTGAGAGVDGAEAGDVAADGAAADNATAGGAADGGDIVAARAAPTAFMWAVVAPEANWKRTLVGWMAGGKPLGPCANPGAWAGGEHLGALLQREGGCEPILYRGVIGGTEVRDGLLRIRPAAGAEAWLQRMGGHDYHAYDITLFWGNVRAQVRDLVESFLKAPPGGQRAAM